MRVNEGRYCWTRSVTASQLASPRCSSHCSGVFAARVIGEEASEGRTTPPVPFYFSRFRFPTCEEELIEARHLNAPGDLREVRVVSCATNDVRSVSSSYDVKHRRFFCLRRRKVEDTVRETPPVDSTQAFFQSSF